MGKRVDCNKRVCLFSKCKKARRCACDICGELKVINPNLYDACLDACQSTPRPTSTEDYLCKDIGAATLFNRFGIVRCGFDPYQSLEGQLYLDSEEKIAQEKANQTRVIIGMGLILGILLLALILD